MKKHIFFLLVILSAILFQHCSTSSKTLTGKSETATVSKERTRDQERVSSIFIEGNKEKILGNYNKAMSLFRQCVEKDSRHAPSYYEMARLLRMQYNIPEAIKMAKKAVEIDGQNEWYQIQLAELYQNAGQNALASKVYSDLLDLHPGNLDYSYELANLYMRMNRFASAIEIMNSIEKQIGINEELSVQKQKLHVLSGNIKQAIAETEALSAAFPDEPRYYSMLAELHLSNKDFDKALEYYNKVLEADPTNPYIRISLAEYYRTIGNSEQSFIELKKGFENPTLDIDTKIQVMLSYYKITEIYQELKSQAFELAEILVETHPDEPKSYSMLADFLIRDEKYSEAREAFRKVISLDSSRYIIWESLLRLHLILEDMDNLVIDSRKAIDLFPLQPLPYLFCALGVMQTNQYTEAIILLNSGKDLVVDDNALLADFYMYLGDSYNQIKNHPLSDLSYEKALEFKPDNAYVLNNFSYYLSLRQERLDEAAAMALLANELSPDNKHYLDTYAWVMYQKKDYQEALIWLEKALIHSGTDNAVVLEHYGDVLYQLGRKAEAWDFWKKALETGEGSELLQNKVNDGILYEE